MCTVRLHSPCFNFDVTTVKSILKAIFYIPANMFKIFKAMRQADHIHLRCPGNTGLLGCFYRFFPKRKQPNMLEIGIQSKQPWTYKPKKKYFKYFFDQKYTGFDLRSMGRTIRELQIIFTASYYEIESKI
jgi:hypothetical protein